MSVFAVVFTGSAQPDAEKELWREFPDAYALGNAAFLVRSDLLSSRIAQKLHIKGDERKYTGVVFKINHSYSGYTSRDLWEWLDEASEE